MKLCNHLIVFCGLQLAIAGCTSQNPAVQKDFIGEDAKTAVRLTDAQKTDPSWSKDNTLIAHWLSDPQNLHPINTQFFNAIWILRLTHLPLIMYDPVNQKMIPVLVKQMPQISSDYLQFTYELVDEAVWDDGSPITARDVIFTFKASKCPLTNDPNLKPYVENIKDIIPDPDNPRRFTIVMRKKYVSSLYSLADDFIISQKFYDPKNILGNYSMEQMDDEHFKADEHPDLVGWANEFNDGKYGNDLALQFGEGPYKVVAWDRDQTITLQRKPNHWTQRLSPSNMYLNALPDKIIFKVLKDENATKLEVKSQQIDVSTWLTTQTLLSLQQDSAFNHNYNSVFMPMYIMQMIAMNEKPDGINRKKLFTDVRVRKAMAMLVPVDQIINVLVMGKGTRLTSMVSPLKKEFNPDLKLIPFDVDGAKKLLDEAGWKDSDGDGIRDKVVDGEKIPMNIEFLYSAQGNSLQQLVTIISESMKQAGINLIPKPVDPVILRTNTSKHDFDMALLSWAADSKPEDYSQLWGTSSWTGNGANCSGFGNAASDALIDSINVTIDDSTRFTMVRRLQKMVYDDQPCIFMYNPYRKVIVHKRFGNAVATADLPGVVINDLRLLSSGDRMATLSNQ